LKEQGPREGEAPADPQTDARPLDGRRLTRAFRLCLARPPAKAELDRLHSYLAQQRERFAADAEAAEHVAPKDRPAGVADAEAAAWTAVARVLMNLDEFMTRE